MEPIEGGEQVSMKSIVMQCGVSVLCFDAWLMKLPEPNWHVKAAAPIILCQRHDGVEWPVPFSATVRFPGIEQHPSKLEKSSNMCLVWVMSPQPFALLGALPPAHKHLNREIVCKGFPRGKLPATNFVK